MKRRTMSTAGALWLLLASCGAAGDEGGSGDSGSEVGWQCFEAGEDPDCEAPSPDEDLAWKSGGRLRAIVARADGGGEQLVRWWDSELETDCLLDPGAADGEFRCLPVATLNGHDYFLDGNCSGPAFSLPEPANASATYYRRYRAGEWVYDRKLGPAPATADSSVHI